MWRLLTSTFFFIIIYFFLLYCFFFLFYITTVKVIIILMFSFSLHLFPSCRASHKVGILRLHIFRSSNKSSQDCGWSEKECANWPDLQKWGLPGGFQEASIASFSLHQPSLYREVSDGCILHHSTKLWAETVFSSVALPCCFIYSKVFLYHNSFSLQFILSDDQLLCRLIRLSQLCYISL